MGPSGGARGEAERRLWARVEEVARAADVLLPAGALPSGTRAEAAAGGLYLFRLRAGA